MTAATIGASGFAPYAGPDLESFDFVYQVPDGPALRVAGSKPRGSVISELDELFGNPPAEVATSGPVFQLQQLYSAFCKDHGPKNNCIQSSGAGYYVVPAGESPSLFGPPETATPHNSFSNPIDGFFAPGGTEVWQADKTFEWLLATAFGPERSSSPP